MEKDIVVFSTISKDHDISHEPARWKRWRPLMELLKLEDFFVSKLYYFVSPSQQPNVNLLQSDLQKISPESEIIPIFIDLKSDFSSRNVREAYKCFDSYFENFIHDQEREEYYFHFGPGNLIAHAFMLTILINTRKLPFKILHLRSQAEQVAHHELDTKFEIYDCAINHWMAEIGAVERDKTDSIDFLKSSIKTQNHAFNTLIKKIEHVSTHSTAPILLSGNTGSGKTRLARKIYELRLNNKMLTGDFVEINCATLCGESAMSTLFGHERGAYTGAMIARNGLLRRAHNGIIFLDEIGELSLDMQILLLKAIEEQRFIPFGADTEVVSNFQLICATNSDLTQGVRAGTFRRDLLSRINLWHFSLPTLRERPEDIEPNIDYELKRITAERGVFADFVPSARKTYLDFATSDRAVWPSNFRSLLGSLERMLTYSFNGVIDDSVVSAEIDLLELRWAEYSDLMLRSGDKDWASFSLISKMSPDSAEGLDLFDKFQLEGTLKVCLDSTNRSQAGRKLFSSSRENKKAKDDTTRLNKYLKSYGLTWEMIHRQK